MKTIFRLVNGGLLLAVMMALGAVAGIAQNPCEDAAGQTTLGDTVREQFKDKTLPGRKKFVETAKQFVQKYGECDPAKDLSEWAKKMIPSSEDTIKKMEAQKIEDDLVIRFNAALTAKNWDELYAAGKVLLANYGEKYRPVEIGLGFVGLEETAKTPRVTKYNEDTLRFARQSIQDLEAGKTFATYGVSIKGGANLEFKNKDDALGWLNYTIGYILFYDKNQKKEALGHLYKTTQIASDAKNEAVIYQMIGGYFSDDVKKLADEVLLLEGQQPNIPDTKPDELRALVEKIKEKVAMVNGTAEAAIDAYARALDVANKNPKTPKPYKDGLLKSLQGLYNLRFGKMDGFDTFVANTIKKPLPNPLDPIKPVVDPESVKTTTTSTTVPAPLPAPIKPGPTSTANPTPAGPAAKPAAAPAKNGIKPRASVKKKATAKRIAE